MNYKDGITRRDFINGMLAATGVLPFGCARKGASSRWEPMARPDSSPYPPALTGLRGNHPGANVHAHDRAWTQKSDWGPTTDLNEEYDLIVVGGGLSGLSAAFFYQQKHGQDKKVLILENHDDFGGHARRNEHHIDGNTRLGFGGSQTIVSPHVRSKVVLDLLQEIGINPERFKTAYDVDFFKRHDLGAVTYFNRKNFGRDTVVKHPFSNYPWYLEGIVRPTLSVEEAVKQTPLSERGREQLLRALKDGLRSLKLSGRELREYISTHSYFHYLQETLGIDDPAVLAMARNSCVDNAGQGADVLTIWEVVETGGLCVDLVDMLEFIYGKEEYEQSLKDHGNIMDERDPYIYHFPDGNASIARGLVKKMVPDVAEGNNAEELLLSPFRYDALDQPGNSARVRLESTVVGVEHAGDPKSAGDVSVNYIKDGKSYRAKGKGVVMACYNMMIPHIVKGLPADQSAALKKQTKVPLQYTTVGLRNWRAMKEMGIGMAMSPGNMHQAVYMDFPVSIGGYKYTRSPDEPCVIQMVCCPLGQTVGAPPREQFREARYTMLGLQFKDYEDEIRAHLSGMLSKGDFDFDRDVAGITVNRWAHGYSYSGSALFDPDMREAAKRGRQPFGRITIANIDSALSSYAHVAIEQAWRAVKELG